MAEKINLSNLSQDQAARKKYSCRILLQEICFSKLFWNLTVWCSFAWIWIFKWTKSILLKNICFRLLRTPQFLKDEQMLAFKLLSSRNYRSN